MVVTISKMVAVAPPCSVLPALQRSAGTVKWQVTVGVGERVAETMCKEERRKEARNWVVVVEEDEEEEEGGRFMASWSRSFWTRGEGGDIGGSREERGLVKVWAVMLRSHWGMSLCSRRRR